MKTADLKAGYYMFGNKGAVWSNTVHIAKSGPGTLCGTPMLSGNHAKYEGVQEIGCKECLTIYKQEAAQ
jgi:hypothetical protein